MAIEILQDFNDDAYSCLLYGPAGIGKTTFAARAEKALIFNLENGLKGIPLKEMETYATNTISEFESFSEAFRDFKNAQKFKTVIVDSVTKLEDMMIRDICNKENKASLADFGYGAGYAKFQAKGSLLCEWIHDLKSAGKNIILIAHEKVETFQDPEAEAYDRWNCSLDKRIAESLKATVDHVFYMHEEKVIHETKSGRNKSKLRNRRLIQTRATGGVVAKTRGDRDQFIEIKNDASASEIWAGL